MRTVEIRCSSCNGVGFDDIEKTIPCKTCKGKRKVSQDVPVDDIVVPEAVENAVKEGEVERRRDADAYTAGLRAMAEKTQRLEGVIAKLATGIVAVGYTEGVTGGIHCPLCCAWKEDGHFDHCVVPLAKEHLS